MTAAAVCAGTIPLYACAPEEESAASYIIDVQFDGGNSLTGSVICTFVNNTDNALDCLKFNLWGNAFREGALISPVSDSAQAQAYYAGESYGGMTVTAVTGGEWQICGEDENLLEVQLGTTLYPEESAVVTIEYVLELAEINGRTGIAEGTVNLGNFYPVLCAYGQYGWLEYTYCSTGDPFVSDIADYRVTLTIPKDYTAAASGELTESSTGGGTTTLTYTMEKTRDFAIVLSQEFKVISRDVNGTRIFYYYTDDGEAAGKLEIAADSFAYFEEKFGAYPYSTLSVVQTAFYQGGMEYPGLTMISADCDEETALYTIVHENAHQWWYAAVGSDSFAHSWQDEGLAEYSALMYFEQNTEYGYTRTGLTGSATKAYRAYFSVYSQLFEGVDTSMERTLDEFTGDYEYANIAYNKALLMFDAVRSACGDDNFVQALAEYFEQYALQTAEPDALVAAFCRYADCEGIFESFLLGKVII